MRWYQEKLDPQQVPCSSRDLSTTTTTSKTSCVHAPKDSACESGAVLLWNEAPLRLIGLSAFPLLAFGPQPHDWVREPRCLGTDCPVQFFRLVPCRAWLSNIGARAELPDPGAERKNVYPAEPSQMPDFVGNRLCRLFFPDQYEEAQTESSLQATIFLAEHVWHSVS